MRGLQDRLSKGDMEFLMMNTRYDEKTIQEWHRGFMSDCPDGRLNTTAFMKVSTSSGKPATLLL